jgi:hypothetical protein
MPLRSRYAPAPHLRPLTASTIEDLIRCEKLFELRHVHRVEEQGYQSALTVGSAVHAGAEALRSWAGHVRDPETPALDAVHDVIDLAGDAGADDAEDPEAHVAQVARDRAKAVAMVTAYAERWRDELLPTQHNEVLLQAPLVNPATGGKSKTFYLRGIADGVMQIAEGWLLIETKTTGDTLPEAEQWLRQSIQVPLYLEMLRTGSGVEVVGAIADIVKKPTIRTRKGESAEEYGARALAAYRAEPDHFFRRVELDVDERQVREAMQVVWRVADQIRAADRHGYLALRGARCRGIHGMCPLQRLCWHHETSGYVFDAPSRYDTHAADQAGKENGRHVTHQSQPEPSDQHEPHGGNENGHDHREPEAAIERERERPEPAGATLEPGAGLAG